MCKEDNERRTQIFERFEKDASKKHKQIMAEIKEQKIHSKIQLATIKKGKKMILLLDDENDEN